MKKLLLICVVFSLGICGCGSGSSSTNGNLTLSPIVSTNKSSGVYNISAISTYVPPAGKVPNGAEIKFSWSAKAGSETSVDGGPVTVTLGSDGIGRISFDVNQSNVPIYITVTSSIGDLSQSSQVTIPAITSFSATPAVITFAAADAAGASQAITLTGTYTPYLATSSNIDINVSVNGGTVTVTKINVTGAVQRNASLTLSDSRGTVIQVPVSYF